jgi:transcription initiation factor IIF auxiliary subunit
MVKLNTSDGKSLNNKIVVNQRWCMFISLNNDTHLTEKYIHSVKYYLSDCYKVKKIEIKNAPFLLSRTDFFSFNIGVKVIF